MAHLSFGEAHTTKRPINAVQRTGLRPVADFYR